MTDTNRYDEAVETTATAVDPSFDKEPTLLERVVAHGGEGVVSTSARVGEDTVTLTPAALLSMMQWLRDEEGFNLCSDVTAYDALGSGDPLRFWVVYHLVRIDLAAPARLRVKVGLPEKKPVIESVVPLWPGADFLEREVYDLMGIEFRNHPNLQRIMMPAEWEGHPLRKDYPQIYEPVAFSHNAAQIDAAKPYARD